MQSVHEQEIYVDGNIITLFFPRKVTDNEGSQLPRNITPGANSVVEKQNIKFSPLQSPIKAQTELVYVLLKDKYKEKENTTLVKRT
ncbi:hypothetical protein RRG08_031441 [Elysia crispata]|uniref:Uncharacterized protein n=1 Tax=Elysia crispata TaxID=231223 RepID=A0AAE0ZMZ7_9GAST|nr:hypothetical protein RRG08_031441 [Elysia crispata]